MLAVPRAFYKSGLLLSGGLVYFAAIISYMSLVALVKVSYKTNKTTFSELAEWSYGVQFKRFTDVVFFVNNFGTAVTYTIVANENFASACLTIKNYIWGGMPELLTDQNAVFWILVCQGALIPLVLKEKLTELRFFAVMSFFIISYIGASIIGNTFKDEYTQHIDSRLDTIKLADYSGISITLPILIFGYTCQQNVLSCYRELMDPNLRRMKKIVTRQIFMASSIYILVGVFGYLTFGNNFPDTDQNILTKYDNSNPTIVIVAYS